MNKKLILLLILVLMTSILCGCKAKAPDNFDKDLWEDSVKVINILNNTIEKNDNFSVKDEDIIKEYYETYRNRSYNNLDESIIITKTYKVYEAYNDLLISKSLDLKYSLLEDEEAFTKSMTELQELYDDLIK